MTNETVKGEICNGIAYIDWKAMRTPSVDSSVMRCIGRYHKFELSGHSFSEFPPSSGDETVHERFVRSVGSTAIMFSEPDDRGRRIGRAQAIGPLSSSAVEAGPIEEKLIEFAFRLEKDGVNRTLLSPVRLLAERSMTVAKRSLIMLKNSIFPVSDFANKMKSRVPEVARESYDIATSIRIEIKIEEGSEKQQ
jgi:hypothetical protein